MISVPIFFSGWRQEEGWEPAKPGQQSGREPGLQSGTFHPGCLHPCCHCTAQSSLFLGWPSSVLRDWARVVDFPCLKASAKTRVFPRTLLSWVTCTASLMDCSHRQAHTLMSWDIWWWPPHGRTRPTRGIGSMDTWEANSTPSTSLSFHRLVAKGSAFAESLLCTSKQLYCIWSLVCYIT